MGLSAGGGGKKSATAVPYINVTPLIDVLLVLLIIFMVITPLKPTRFKALVPEEPDPNMDMTNVKPNPLTLVVSVDNSLGIKLNTDSAGSVNDPAPLATRLSSIFAERRNNRAYKPGYENRLDLTEAERIEKTVFVKAPRSLPYGDVVKVIDAIKGAGANPVGLQIDDLAQ
ncbi:MAG: biopolymer transporter ExbD [Pyrinomonadaceae bacterium]|nr:biopolymer transporter ExbD [Pyrinomonadaceae bacterium]MDQ3134931.1 biopolymer transporter ExbD [Acidobacteriota bacterium]